ncbi:MAG: hypothetical protein JO217_06695, partial [Acidobacteriaceae bacterium]|nr:hypothetical protein [Acidobacteriaceae bacterium]
MANGEELNKAPTEAVGIPNAVPSGPANGISSRYQRFQQILDRAAGNSTATYGGLGARFWKTLGIPELLDARLEGMRLIAPENEPTHSCCASKSEPQPVASRADRSALIAGLRGLPPFDGSGFPRLMWGGSAVSEDDIQFIADWINDGLPATA